MNQPHRRALPLVTDLNRHFWCGGADGRLHILQCGGCADWIHPPQPICPRCLSRNVAPQATCGRGTIASFTVNHQPWSAGMSVPFVIALVALEEAPSVRLTTNIVNCPPDAVHIGQPVRVTFEQDQDVFLPMFEPAGTIPSPGTIPSH